jgi:hypothetical protein
VNVKFKVTYTMHKIMQVSFKPSMSLFKIYYPKKVKDHPIKTLIDSINGMVEQWFADRTSLLLLLSGWYQFMHKIV